VEKYHIAQKHLLPKARETMGIPASRLKVTDKAIHLMIEEYTMESGVRGLKKQIDTLCRAAAVRLVAEHPVKRSGRPSHLVREKKNISISAKNLPAYLGRAPLSHEHKLKDAQPGVVTGLAWTQAGGEILFIETQLVKGSGEITITGQLGDVMKESAQIALTLVRAMYPKECEKLHDCDLHIHVPDGAVPKDGPSAGITLVTALASLVTGHPVSTEYAMTGEVSLRGGVMPIGGLPEKLMAAQRAGITKVLIPAANEPDLEDVAEEVKEKLEIIPVKKVTDVLKLLL
jgi:ATP-dependent Lon protease